MEDNLFSFLYGDEEKDSVSVLIYGIGDREYGIAIENVVEIITYPKLTPVRCAGKNIEGVFPFRDRIAAALCIDEEMEKDINDMMVVTDIDGCEFGIHVNTVNRIVSIYKEDYATGEAVKIAGEENSINIPDYSKNLKSLCQ